MDHTQAGPAVEHQGFQAAFPFQRKKYIVVQQLLLDDMANYMQTRLFHRALDKFAEIEVRHQSAKPPQSESR